MPQVRVIQPISEQAKKLRVAAYARVSSDSADQLNSFATQVTYYTDFIQSKDEWEFSGLYADEAVSGTTAEKRDDFQRLLADCRAGKIDRILVKSISRFARNTLDCLQTVRELKQLGVAVEFEKEGIDTGNMGSEMLLSILGSAAQEESLSISKNLKWSYRRRMRSGDFITCNAPLGYFLASIQSNYNLYLKDNVAQYIQLTNKLAEFISDVVSKTGDYAVSLLEKFKTNLFAILGFLFTVVLANIVSDQPLDNIFTRDITFILEAVLFISAAYLVICVLETKYKIRKIRDSYNALKNNYTSILTPDDLNMAFGNDKIMKEMSAEVNKGIRRYACLWGVFILISLIAIELISVDPVIWSLFQRLF